MNRGRPAVSIHSRLIAASVTVNLRFETTTIHDGLCSVFNDVLSGGGPTRILESEMVYSDTNVAAASFRVRVINPAPVIYADKRNDSPRSGSDDKSSGIKVVAIRKNLMSSHRISELKFNRSLSRTFSAIIYRRLDLPSARFQPRKSSYVHVTVRKEIHVIGENWAKARRGVRAHLFSQRMQKIHAWHRAGVFEESKGSSDSYWFILMPDGPFTKFYNVVTAFAVLYVGFSVFLVLGFANFLLPTSLHDFERFIDAWFWFDLALNFFTAFYHNGKIVTHPLEIAIHYCRSWFLVDLFGNIPFEYILDTNSTSRARRELVKMLKFLKIPRLLRLARLRRILQGKGKYVSLVVYFALVVLGIHAAGCLWMLVLEPCGHFPPECLSDGTLCDWRHFEDIVPSIIINNPYLGPECLPSNIGTLYAMAFAYGASMVLGASGLDPTTMDGGHYRTREFSIEDDLTNSLSSSYSFFNSTVSNNTPSTLTLHDLVNVSPFTPNSFGNASWTVMWILGAIMRIFGYVVVAFFTGIILKLEINAGYRETMFRRRVDAIEAELHSYGALIPEPLMRRIREHIAERWHSGDFGHSELMTSDIFSDQLRGEIVAALNKDVLMKIPFFRSATFEAIQQVCAVAQERKFLAGELIYRRGEISSGLYLVRSGTVIVSPLSYSSWGGSIRRRWNPDDDGGTAALHEEIRDEGTRPMKVSYIRMKRKAKASLRRSFTRRNLFKSGRSNFHQSSSTVFPLSTTAFPVTAGSWFGESELLREIVEDSSDPSDCRRTTTVEAKSNVRLLFISKNDLSKILFENPQILMELLICHEKRFNSADLPDDLREAFRFSDEWEDRVHRVIAEISKARQINIFPPSTLS